MTTLEHHFIKLATEITVRPMWSDDSVDQLISYLEERTVLGYTKRYDDLKLYGVAWEFLEELDNSSPEKNWKQAIALLKKAQKILNNIPSLKVWPEYFKPISRGEKTFEVRQGQFMTDQFLFLKEWNRATEEYTGRALLIQITYVLPLTSGGLGDNCVLPFPVDPVQPVCVFGFVKL